MAATAGNNSATRCRTAGDDQSDAERFRGEIGSPTVFRSASCGELAGAVSRGEKQVSVCALKRLEPQTGTAFELRAGQQLRVIDLEGEQVADLIAFNLSDKNEWLSSGRTIDYANRIYLTKGDMLYSNRSRPMLAIARH